MITTGYKKRLKELMNDPRKQPENDWHEQWLIDMQDLDQEFTNQALRIIESLLGLAYELRPDPEFYGDYEFEERLAEARAFLDQHLGSI